jgi:pimeloyl-ACP methyl ester carboxylesterase
MVREQAPLVLVHGDFGDGEDAWGDVVARIGPRRRSVIVDRPGNEVLRLPENRHTFASEAAAVLEVVRWLGEPQVHLAGHSYGALVALEIATTRPDLIRSLHLIEPPFFALVPDHEAAQAMNREARRIQADFARAGEEQSTEDFFAMIGLGHVVERLRGTPEWDRFTAQAERFARSEPAGDFPASALERLPRDMPVALYTGGRSHPVLRDIVAELAKRLPGAQVIEIADANHAVQRAGELFVSRLLAIADAADAAARGRELPIPADAARE